MAIYTVESDKIFLRSLGDGIVEVNEVENLNISLLQERHWTVCPTITIGRQKEYEILLIGDTEIKGRDLTTVLKDLCDLQFMVNREGLCILPTTGIVNEDFDVEYYRIFDLFEWSKYGVNVSLNTTWSRSDVLNGRSILATTPFPDYFVSVKTSKIESGSDVMLEERKSKLESWECQNVDFERELKFRHSDLQPSDYHQKRLELYKTMSSPMNVIIDETVTGSRKWNTSIIPTIAHVDDWFIADEAIATLTPELRVSSATADAENWWTIKVIVEYNSSGVQRKRFTGVFVYYDGNFGYHKFEKIEKMPVPVRDGVPFHLTNGIAFFLKGIGPRYGSFIADA